MKKKHINKVHYYIAHVIIASVILIFFSLVKKALKTRVFFDFFLLAIILVILGYVFLGEGKGYAGWQKKII